jgi:hypothetical protein
MSLPKATDKSDTTNTATETFYERGDRVALSAIPGVAAIFGSVIHQHGQVVWVDWDDDTFPHALVPEEHVRPQVVN